MGDLRATNSEIVEALVRRERRRQRQAVRRRPLVLIDVLVADLEELHLAGRRRVPASYAPRLRSLTAALPVTRRRQLRTGITIVHLIDNLFEVRQGLLGAPLPDGQLPDGTGVRLMTPAKAAGEVDRLAYRGRAVGRAMECDDPHRAGGPPPPGVCEDGSTVRVAERQRRDRRDSRAVGSERWP